MSSHLVFAGAALLCCGVIYAAENNRRTGYFSILMFGAIAGIFEIATSNRWAALLASSMIMSSVWLASKNKYKHTKFALIYNDLFGFDRKVYRDVFRTYGKEASKVVLLGTASFASVVILAFLSSNDTNDLFFVYLFTVLCSVGAWFLAPLAMKEYRRANFDGRHISTFFATMVSQGFRPSEMTHLELGATPSVADVVRPAKKATKAPHIILIGGESTFPPRLLGFPEESDISQFFDGTEGCRDLNVEIFGGQTILSHTSCLTGLSTLLFGGNRSYAPRFWKGRIDVSLPFFLKSHGYSVRAFLSGQRDWMGIGGLYDSIGVDHTFEASEYTTAKEVDAMYARDASVYNAALADIRLHIGQGRTCTIVETMRNHGPHDRTLLEEFRELASKTWFAKTCKTLEGSILDQAAEWYGRLRASVDDYNSFKSGLRSAHPDETFLIVHYGDHQPPYCAAIPNVTTENMYKTYLTVDWVGQPLSTSQSYARESLPIYYVDLLVAQAAGLPLDGFLEAKAELVKTDPENLGFESPQYHGLIASLVQAGKLRPGSVSTKPVRISA